MKLTLKCVACKRKQSSANTREIELCRKCGMPMVIVAVSGKQKRPLLSVGEVARLLKITDTQVIRLTRHDAADTRSPARSLKLHSRQPPHGLRLFGNRLYAAAEVDRFVKLVRPRGPQKPGRTRNK